MENFEQLVIENIKSKISLGTDIKMLQYENTHPEICTDKINLIKLINDNLQIKTEIDKLEEHVILINIPKDIERYKNTVLELKHFDINNFIHMKATFWRNDRKFLQDDLNTILTFLKRFNDKIKLTDKDEILDQKITVKENDENIKIQDGPLACYCSHVRSMIYGYLNFNDYTIIVEDDIKIVDTQLITEALKNIPNDWDILCFGSKSIKHKYEEKYYKFIGNWHSTHFTVYRNSILPYIFKHIYPIIDQIDVLISYLYDNINIYNISDVVCQKTISTRTQNNLHAIFTSPNYDYLRVLFNELNDNLYEYMNIRIINNTCRNKIISNNIIYDIICEHIINSDMYILN